jgi:hypothetical protein
MHPTFCKVTINICAHIGPTKITNIAATNIDNKHDNEQVRYGAQPQVPAISSQQVST